MVDDTDSKLTVTMKGIVKRFPGVVANDGVDFEARAGEVHALLGENGAGKSTLSNVLTGLYRPDEGTISLNNEVVHFDSPREALERGIGMVHQHFRLVNSFTVAENIILGEQSKNLMMDTSATIERISAYATQYGIAVDPNARIWQLSVGEQQRVEILKALYHGAKILILDEPTAVLLPVREPGAATQRCWAGHPLLHINRQGRNTIIDRDGRYLTGGQVRHGLDFIVLP